VKSVSEFVFIPDIFHVLPAVHQAGYLAVVVTNQRGIARGLMSESDLEEIHNWMQQQLAERCGTQFDAIYHCPHNHDDDCRCRKPRPGMLLDAAGDHNIDLRGSWMIGDSETDIEAGIAAGCHTVIVAPADTLSRAEHHASTLHEAWSTVQEIASQR
jgi:D-glycero-D-manno-heptose 1,7-bisphosphate phosphatase